MTRLALDDTAACRAFIAAETVLQSPPLVPEIRLHLASDSLAIWRKTEEELGAMNVPPPFWAFAWAGGQALGRYLMDQPSLAAGKSVLDLGAGSGLTAVAAAQIGARTVLAADIDPLSIAAIELNAAANGVAVATTNANLLAEPPPAVDLLLVGDLFYERPLAERVLDWITAARANGAQVLIGDPQRSYFPVGRFLERARYRVPVSRDLEDAEIKNTAVWELV
jgi:predicted nicotinamide N-methyase